MEGKSNPSTLLHSCCIVFEHRTEADKIGSTISRRKFVEAVTILDSSHLDYRHCGVHMNEICMIYVH